MFDLNTLSVEEIIELGAELASDLEKTASADLDLNEMTAEEFVEFAAALADEVSHEKTAGYGRMLMDALTAKKFRKAYNMPLEEMSMRSMRKGPDADMAAAAGAPFSDGNIAMEYLKKQRRNKMLRGAAETGAVYGIPATAAAGGAYVMTRKKKK